MRDNVNKLGTSVHYSAANMAVIKTTVTGDAIDLAGYNAAAIYVNCGTWTDGTHTFKVQESATTTSGDFADAAAGDLTRIETANSAGGLPITVAAAANPFLAVSSAATALNTRVGYLGAKRYIRVLDTVTGSPGTGAAYSVHIVLGEARVQPAAV